MAETQEFGTQKLPLDVWLNLTHSMRLFEGEISEGAIEFAKAHLLYERPEFETAEFKLYDPGIERLDERRLADALDRFDARLNAEREEEKLMAVGLHDFIDQVIELLLHTYKSRRI